MTHPWDKQYSIVFIIMLVSGIALCIAGIWITPLLVPGGVALTGAAAMFANAFTRMYPWRQDNEAPKAAEPHIHSETINIIVEDHHTEFHPHFDMIVRAPNPSLEIRELEAEASERKLTII